jgi:hypothetical protein
MEVLIPGLHQSRPVLRNKSLYGADFSAPEPAALLQSYGVKPEFGNMVVASNMDMRCRIPVAGI